MLIKTHRHTWQDLELWQDYEESDLTGYWSVKKRNWSIDVILDWASSHDRVVACTSWGKDSVVLLHLLMLSGVKVPVVYMRFRDRANPDCDLVRDEFLRMFPMDYHEEVFDYSKVRKSGLHWKAIAKKWGEFRLTGIRNDESGKRQLQWNMTGFSSLHSCRPLSLWTNKEIFAYIAQHDLPLSPVYGYLGGGRYNRDKIRTHSLVGSSGDGIGRTEWELEYYGDEIRKIHTMKQ